MLNKFYACGVDSDSLEASDSFIVCFFRITDDLTMFLLFLGDFEICIVFDHLNRNFYFTFTNVPLNLTYITVKL